MKSLHLTVWVLDTIEPSSTLRKPDTYASSLLLLSSTSSSADPSSATIGRLPIPKTNHMCIKCGGVKMKRPCRNCDNYSFLLLCIKCEEEKRGSRMGWMRWGFTWNWKDRRRRRRSGRKWKVAGVTTSWKSSWGVQAPKAWYQCLRDFLEGCGFTNSLTDSSLFVQCRGNRTIYVLIYIDDFIIIRDDEDDLREFIKIVCFTFQCRDLE